VNRRRSLVKNSLDIVSSLAIDNKFIHLNLSQGKLALGIKATNGVVL
jgi:hypothetical protein